MEALDDEEGENDEEGSESAAATFAQPVSAVPKCLSCGAPHPTSTTCHRFEDLLLCYLCWETSSTLIADQQEVRNDEYLDPELYDKVPFESKANGEKDSAEDESDDFDFSTDTIEFRVPVEQKTAKDDDAGPKEKDSRAIWQLPAVACPPVWWIIVDGTVGNTTTMAAAKNYWTTVGATLSRAIEDIPPHVHVGLLTATGSRLASWDLTSAVPHVQQYPYSYDPSDADAVEGGGVGQTTSADDASDTQADSWDFSLVPADGSHKANLEAAIRAMVDGAMLGLFRDGSSDDGEDNDEGETNKYMPLALTLEILLEFMEEAGHPGHELFDDGGASGDGMTQLRYAGGKILCLMGNPTLETGRPPTDDSLSYIGQSSYGLGGVAGACRSEDDIVEKNGHASRNGTKTDPTDLTPSNLKEYALPLDPEDLFVKIGFRCAQAALGVDLIVLVPEEDDDTLGSQTIPWYGLPLLRPLSDASGAPGPLMFGTGNIGDIEGSDDEDEEASVDTKYVEKFDPLFENVLARTPWQSGVVFGAQMKLRLSPGLNVESTPLETKRNQSLQLSKFLTSRGLGGPAVALSEINEADGTVGGKSKSLEDEEEDYMWVLGSCDPHTSVVIDMEFDDKDDLPDTAEIEGVGPVDVKPVVQICTLFTCVETDGEENPSYWTVCKMRVSSVSLDFADDHEAIYNSVDPEALSLILFNKMALEAYVGGFRDVQDAAESYLLATMVAVYNSAKEQQAKLEDDPNDKVKPTFVACDRLLDEKGGELEETEILLCEGHPKMRCLALLVYAIMQCDALRPCGKGFRPSMDARLCAITQLSSMTPSALVSTFAPSLSLWSLDDDIVVKDWLPLSKVGILEELNKMDKETTKNSVLLLESTQGVLLFTPKSLAEMDSKKSKHNSSKTKKEKYTIGPELNETIANALVGYRTLPKQLKELESLFDNNGYGDLNELTVLPADLHPLLVEDKPTFGGDENFEEWKLKMAEIAWKEIEDKEAALAKTGRSRLSRFFFRDTLS
jgi:hypothetical protein